MINNWQFGTRSDGQAVSAYQLTSEAGFRAVILEQGAILQSFYLPNGRNITLNFDTWKSYEHDTHYLGRIIGPNANRIVNSKFQIGEDKFELPANDGIHNLHSGPNGFDTQLWTVSRIDTGLNLELKTPHNFGGFPGNIKACLEISLVQNILRLEIKVTADQSTPVNLTWHPYWNLSGETKIDGHDLYVNAEHHTRLDTQSPLPVEDTFRDFRKPLPLGGVQLDTNYSDVEKTQLTSGDTAMTITSSLPDLQVYTGDGLLRPRSGIAFEPQYRPNDINLGQDSLLRPGETYSHWIEYCFTV